MKKLNFEKNGEGFNRHHKYPRERGGSWDVDNIELMRIINHRAHHILFGNATPIEQLTSQLSFNSSTLIRECREDIAKVLRLWDKEGIDAYNPKIFK